MPFTPLLQSNGQPDPDAVLEAATAIEAIYDGTAADVTALLSACGGGILQRFYRVPGTLPPGYAVASQGPNWYVWIAGTVSLSQMVRHVVGAAHVERSGMGLYRNAFFGLIAERLRQSLVALLPPSPAAITIHVAGHSYGAAVGQLLCLDLADDYTPSQVTFLGLGTPKSRSSGWVVAEPAVSIRVARTGDPVAVLPPSYAQGGTSIFSVLFGGRLGHSVGWAHYGQGYRLDDTGALDPDSADGVDGWLPSWRVSDLAVEQHVIRGVCEVLLAAG